MGGGTSTAGTIGGTPQTLLNQVRQHKGDTPLRLHGSILATIFQCGRFTLTAIARHHLPPKISRIFLLLLLFRNLLLNYG